MAEEGKVLIGIVGIILFLILIMNPEVLIGLLVWATTAIVVIGGFAFCVFVMFLILKEIFK
jgi:uncharacterized membrane protein HdeD (DUF308 family)